MTERPVRHTAPIPPQDVPAANERFDVERQAFDFRYRCEDCTHFDPAPHRCSLGFETELFGRGPHRCRLDDGRLVFCKYFEID